MFQEKKPLWRNFSVWMLCISSVFWHAFVYADNSRVEKHELKSLYEIAWERQPESKCCACKTKDCKQLLGQSGIY